MHQTLRAASIEKLAIACLLTVSTSILFSIKLFFSQNAVPLPCVEVGCMHYCCAASYIVQGLFTVVNRHAVTYNVRI